MRKTISADEHETSFYSNYALIALGLSCGFTKHREIVRTFIRDLLEDKLTEGDHQYMRRKRNGDVVPTTESYPGIKWERWHSSFNSALYNLVDDGLVAKDFTLTDQGIVQLATLARSGVYVLSYHDEVSSTRKTEH